MSALFVYIKFNSQGVLSFLRWLSFLAQQGCSYFSVSGICVLLYKISVLFSRDWEDASSILSCTYPCWLNVSSMEAQF